LILQLGPGVLTVLAFWVLEGRNGTDWWERGFFVIEDDKSGTG
jgi:hypothetical protein